MAVSQFLTTHFSTELLLCRNRKEKVEDVLSMGWNRVALKQIQTLNLIESNHRRLSYFFISSSSSSSTIPCSAISTGTAQIKVHDESCQMPCPKRLLLQQEGFTGLQIRSLCEGPYSHHLLAISHTKLASLLGILKKHGVSGPVSGNLLTQSPTVLRLSLRNVEEKIEFFGHYLGANDPRLLLKLITHCAGNNSLISMSLQNIRRHMSLLHEELGMDPADIRKILRKFPSFLILNLQRNLLTKVRWLQEKGLDKKAISWLWKTYPNVMHLSIEQGLSERLELLKEYDLDLNSKEGLKALGFWSSRSLKTLLARFEALQKHGISRSDAVQIVRKHPGVICCKEETIAKKIDYLIDTLHLDISELVHFPAFLNYSLEKRIIPRYDALRKLKSKGLLKKDLTVSSVLSLSNEEFTKKFQSRAS